MIIAADHMRDVHLDVVHHIYEVKNPAAVWTTDRHVGVDLSVRHIHLHAPADEVIDDDHLARKSEPPSSIVFVDMAARLEFLEVAKVDGFALTLEIRAAISANIRTFIPVQSEPLHPVENRLHRRLGVPRFVGVLDAQDKRPTQVPGIKPIKQCSPRSTNM
jgi:hypothetical protein